MRRSISRIDVPATRSMRKLRFAAPRSALSGVIRRPDTTSLRTNSRISPSTFVTVLKASSGDLPFSSGVRFGLTTVMCPSLLANSVLDNEERYRADSDTRLGPSGDDSWAGNGVFWRKMRRTGLPPARLPGSGLNQSEWLLQRTRGAVASAAMAQLAWPALA